MKQITLKKDQYATLKLIAKAVSKDKLRPSLMYVLYEHEHKQIIACDGHILRIEHFEIDDCNESLLISTEDIKTARQDGSLYTLFIDDKGFKYPRWRNVIPDFDNADMIHAIHFEPSVMVKLMSTFPKTVKSVKFVFKSPQTGVGIYTFQDDVYEMAGLIMPVILK